MIKHSLLIALLLSTPAYAQDKDDRKQTTQEKKDAKEEEKDSSKGKDDQTLEKAGNIVTQPGRDIGIDKAKIPPILTTAVANPYAMPKPLGCRAINADLVELNTALGPDFTVGVEKNEDRAGNIAEAVGKTLVNSLIPFRGLIREVSGAAPAERRLEAAVSAGLARRGFLRGLAVTRKCRAVS